MNGAGAVEVRSKKVLSRFCPFLCSHFLGEAKVKTADMGKKK